MRRTVHIVKFDLLLTKLKCKSMRRAMNHIHHGGGWTNIRLDFLCDIAMFYLCNYVFQVCVKRTKMFQLNKKRTERILSFRTHSSRVS